MRLASKNEADFATGAWPQTAGREVAQFMSACWWPKNSFQYNWKLKFVDLKYTDFGNYKTINMFKNH